MDTLFCGGGAEGVWNRRVFIMLRVRVNGYTFLGGGGGEGIFRIVFAYLLKKGLR